MWHQDLQKYDRTRRAKITDTMWTFSSVSEWKFKPFSAIQRVKNWSIYSISPPNHLHLYFSVWYCRAESISSPQRRGVIPFSQVLGGNVPLPTRAFPLCGDLMLGLSVEELFNTKGLWLAQQSSHHTPASLTDSDRKPNGKDIFGICCL